MLGMQDGVGLLCVEGRMDCGARMYIDVDVAERLHSWTAAVAIPICGESVEVLGTTEPHRDILWTCTSRQPHRVTSERRKEHDLTCMSCTHSSYIFSVGEHLFSADKNAHSS